MSQVSKARGACIICRKRKIKCDLADVGRPCTNCQSGDYECLPHQRKRKRYTILDNAETDIRHTSGGSNSKLPPISGISEAGLSSHTLVDESPVTERSYVGRGEYLGGQVPFTEAMAGRSRPSSPGDTSTVPDIELRYLQMQHAFDLPPRATRASLIDIFMERCHPWSPIVDRQWLEDRGENQASILLQQSVFLAATRMLSAPLMFASSEDFYTRARALFFHGMEGNTIIAIVASCLLQWWNPTGPETISTNTSGFWIRIGVGLAYQIGLHQDPTGGRHQGFRRRLWWTLVVRDNIISVGVGRPRTINLDDCSVQPLSLSDFQVVNSNAQLFIAYVDICRKMGDIAEAHRRRSLNEVRKQLFEDSLYRWINLLPAPLQLFHGPSPRSLASYNLDALQLHAPYFACLLILYRNSATSSAETVTTFVASSFLVGILEEILARDEIRFLGPVFTFYALASGLIGLAKFRYESLGATAESEFEITKTALEQLAQRWGSANGALRALTKARATIQEQQSTEVEPTQLSTRLQSFFTNFGPDLCRMWHPFVEPRSKYAPNTSNTQQQTMAPVTPTTFQGFDQRSNADYTATIPEQNVAGDALFDPGLGAPEDALPSMASWLFDDIEFGLSF